MLILFSISCVNANENDTLLSDNNDEDVISVSDNNDEDVISISDENDNLTADKGTYSELEYAFQVNEKFTFEKDYVAHVGDGIINIKRSIEIDGNGHSIDANWATSIFQSEGSQCNGINVVIKNLILKNSRGDRAAVTVGNCKNVHYTIINCTFVNNQVTFAGHPGGAIFFRCDGGHLDISDSTFEKNSVSASSGGAIYLDAESHGIRNSIFEENKANGDDGGAIYIDGRNKNGVIIENCIFDRNQAYTESSPCSGGAIYNYGYGNLRLINSSFNNNTALPKIGGSALFYDGKGGAVYSENKLELDGCTFIDNKVMNHGGAVYANVLVWLEHPSTFINNKVETNGVIVANKGGAVYASTFQNNAFGHVFINNSAYYGGAVYINNKNDVVFQSCYFEGNAALTRDSSQGSGAAIYIDSSSSKVSLLDNIFFNNAATSDSGVFNCGKWGTIAHNWWGTNNPNFKDQRYIVEWHRASSNSIIQDSSFLHAVLASDESGLPASDVKLTVSFVDNNGVNFNGKLTNLGAVFSSDKGGKFTDEQINDNNITVVYTPNGNPNVVTAKIHNQVLTHTVNTTGNFTWLQQQIDAASGIYNLNRDLTYTIGADNIIAEGILINKPLVINGNGHKLDALSQSRIFNIKSNDVTINNITFVNGKTAGANGGAINIGGENNIKILNSKFTDNVAQNYGGAIYTNGGKNIQIINSQFNNNQVSMFGGGAIDLNSQNSLIQNSIFSNNNALSGGAVEIHADNVVIDGCDFRSNSASGSVRGGGAISNYNQNLTVKNSIFLNNKAVSTAILYENKDDNLILRLNGMENYINAIKSDFNVTFTNVTYWDGEVTTGNNPMRSDDETGQNIALVIYDNNGKAVKIVTLKTNSEGYAKFDYSSLKEGKYTFIATHEDDSYYTEAKVNGNFNVTDSSLYPSSVKINIDDKAEFSYNDCIISFDVTNKTEVGMLITNADHTNIFFSNVTDLNYVIVDLPASDEYYSIIVENLGNETYEASSDTKLFKLLKVNSTVSINPIDDVTYGDDALVKFSGDGESYNVTVFDKNNKPVFSQIVDKQSVNVTNLTVGQYGVVVTNLGNQNKTRSKASTSFNVVQRNNNFKVAVDNVTYGDEVNVIVSADVDGKYSVDINSTKLTVDVVKGTGSTSLYLDAGNYYANVSFNNQNYKNNSTNTNFIVEKAHSNVYFYLDNVTYNTTVNVYIDDDFPVEFNITIYDQGNNIVFNKITEDDEFILPDLDVGQYNLTVINLGDKNIIGSEYSEIFDVTLDNHVEITVIDTVFGRELLIYLEADVDGYYTVDINGTELVIEVIDGFAYNDTLELFAGEYYANVTFDNPDYNNIIENTTFTIYQAESNLQIYDIENVTYGNDVTLKYEDDYNAIFEVVVFDENEEEVWKFKTNATTAVISGLCAGNYTLMVTNEGDENIIGVSEFKNFTVYKATPKMKVTSQDNEINVELPEDATGDVSTIINGKEEFYPVVEGLAIIPLYELKPGNYSFDVKYLGDKNYTTNSGKVNVEISKITPEMTVTANQTEITIELPDDATGSVKTTVDGKEITVPVSEGKTTIPLGELNPGNYTFDVRYSGNDKYYSRTEKTSVDIPRIDPDMTAFYEDNEVIVELPDDAAGNVTAVVGGVEHSSPVVEGIAIIPLYDLKPGNYSINLNYSGDDKYLPDSDTVDVELDKITPDMAVAVKDNIIAVELPDDVVGSVVATVDGKNFTAPVKDGKATITVTGLDPGKHSVDVRYSGDDKYYPKSVKIDVNIPKVNPEMKVHKNDENIIVELPKDAEGNVTMDVNGEKITVPVENGMAEFSLDDLPSGDYDVAITYSGDDKYNPITKNEKIIIDGIELVADDVVKYVSGPERLVVTLLNNDKPIKSKVINMTINGITYTRTTNDKGQVSLALNLGTGNYTALVEADEYSLATLVDIEVKTTINSKDLVKIFRNATQYYAQFLDGNGNPLVNKDAEFNINGVFYIRKTNATGWAKLNINLEAGEYIITSNNTVTGETKGNLVTVISLLESDELTKYFRNESQYVVRVHSDDGGWAKAGEKVTFNINGIFYTRTTNETGHAKLNINLYPGKYIVTAQYKDCLKSNNIVVLPVLTADDLNMKYKDGSKFRAKLVNGQGKAYPGQSITFNVNGVSYNRTTNSDGEARLNINLIPGQYIITSSYNESYISNKITISS